MQGIEDEYNELVDQFDLKKTANDASPPTPRLRLWLMALSHVVSRLDKQHSTLVQGIVDLPWTTMESNFVQTYINFIGILVSARPEYLTLVLGKIARGFTYRMCHYVYIILTCIDYMFRIWSSSTRRTWRRELDESSHPQGCLRSPSHLAPTSPGAGAYATCCTRTTSRPQFSS